MIIFAVLLSLSWAGPLVVGRGAGESEYSIMFTRTYLPQLLHECEGPCHLTPQEQAVLKKLVAASAQPPQAVFKDDQGAPLFVNQTSLKEVWFNRDLLWQDAEKSKAMDEPAAVNLWIDVIGQLMSASPQLLHSIQSELEHVLRSRFNSVELPDEHFQASLWTPPGAASDRLFIRDAGFNGYEFTEVLSDLAVCTDGGKSSNLRLRSLRWENSRLTAEGTLELSLTVTQTWQCLTEARRARAIFMVRAKTQDSTYFLDADSAHAYLEGE